mmetsp:Transcript_31282/g.47900  ORF Transcript_31282/g.47900 Transcript_31282/m.47900 type:complete len:145 (-) Transcript_31282:472-906(-)
MRFSTFPPLIRTASENHFSKKIPQFVNHSYSRDYPQIPAPLSLQSRVCSKWRLPETRNLLFCLLTFSIQANDLLREEGKCAVIQFPHAMKIQQVKFPCALVGELPLINISTVGIKCSQHDNTKWSNDIGVLRGVEWIEMIISLL